MPQKVRPRRKLSREEQKNLDIEIGFLEGVLKRDPHFTDALQILGEDYTRRGRYSEGLRVDERLAELNPTQPLAHYNLACSYSLTGQYNLAFGALERALSLGYCDFRWMSKDPDLSDFRRHPLYRKIRAKIRSIRIKVS
jgi:tetratricopeptide (TPR) repeat protein